MTYRERVLEKLQEARASVEKVKANMPANAEEFLGMGLVKDGIYKNIEFAIQNTIDICAILVKDFELPIPKEEADIFRELGEHGIISKSVLSIIIRMRGFRNFLVHRYGKIDDIQAYKDVKEGLNDFEKVFKAFEDAIERSRK